MIKSNIKETFKSDIKTVWDVVTNNKEFSWRSDVSKIEVLEDENTFIEYTKDGFSTKFTITKKEVYELYEFDIENKNIKGHWIGKFKQVNDHETEIDFTEEIEVDNLVMKLFGKMYLKKQQQTYIEDLRKKVKIIKKR